MLRLTVLSLFFLIVSGTGTAVLGQDCTPPKIIANAKAYNIFNPEQEMVLGELTYQRMMRDLRLVHDPQLNAYLTRIGERIAKHLPPIGIKYQFHIIDLPDANAFNIPGGYVFVSRKLIAFSHTEDELAGVLAHELGHATVRHGAVDFSALLKKVLNVTELGDRKDVSEKYNLFLERHRTKRIVRDRSHMDDQQLEADRIGLYAMVAAGYDPAAFADFYGRLVESKPTRGNWFSDIFGKPKPEEKRLREMVTATEKLPAQCRENRSGRGSTEEFIAWQANVVSYREAHRKEELPALMWKKELSPKLRTDLSHLAFSPDGKLLLAQDDFSITVIRRDPLEVVFQIPAEDARQASFSADGQFVVFGTENLRFEKWSIADKKPVASRELVLRRDCWEHEFSPDGNFLTCVDYGLNLNVLDTQTGKKLWEKKEFYRLDFFEYISWIVRDQDDSANRLFHIQYSPDSKLAIIARSNHARFSFQIDMLEVGGTENTVLALDLTAWKPIGLGGEIKKLARRPFLFLDSNRMLGMPSSKSEDAGVFSFPEGKRLAKFPLGGKELKRTSNPNYVVVKPINNARLGVFDLSRQKLVAGFNKEDVDFWNDTAAYESITGKVLLSELQYNEEKKTLDRKGVGATVGIPEGAVGRLYTAQVSDNFRWLAVSSKTRGAIWELNTGEQKLFLRGFRGALIANDGGAIADFPKQDPVNHSLVLLNSLTKDASPIREIPEKGARQYRGFVLIRQSLRQPTKSQKEFEKQIQALSPDDESERDISLRREVRFELRQVIDDKVVWTRDFTKEAPGYFFDQNSGRLIFYWTLGSDVGKGKLKENPALAARAREMGNKDDDYLFELVDAFEGKTMGNVLVETGKGSFEIESAFSEHDWLLLRDDDNRVLAYSITDGDVRHRFFGAEAALNVVRQKIVVENYPGELTIYDLTSGDPESRLVLNRDAVLTRFSADGKRLFVLTSEQVAYAFDMDRLPGRALPITQNSP